VTAIVWAALGITAIAVAGLIGFGVAALAARKDAGSEKARADVLAVRLETAIANMKTETLAKNAEKERADALDDAIATEAVAAVGSVGGSFERLLQASSDARARAAGRRGPAVVPVAEPAGGEAEAVGSDDLLKPGE
jgi:hypothetical protein